MLFESQNVVFAPPAQVAELADALASGASVRKDVGVQVPPWAHVMETSHFKVWGFSHFSLIDAHLSALI